MTALARPAPVLKSAAVCPWDFHEPAPPAHVAAAADMSLPRRPSDTDSLASTITPLPPASVYARATLKGAHAAAARASVCSDTLTLCSDDGTDDGDDAGPVTPTRSSVSSDGDGATVFDPDSPLASPPASADAAPDYFGLDTDDDDYADADAFDAALSYPPKTRPRAASRKSRALLGATLAQALDLDFCCRGELEGAFPSAPAPAPAARSSLAFPSASADLPPVAPPTVLDAGVRPRHRARRLSRAAKSVRPHFARPFAHHAAAAAAAAASESSENVDEVDPAEMRAGRLRRLSVSLGADFSCPGSESDADTQEDDEGQASDMDDVAAGVADTVAAPAPDRVLPAPLAVRTAIPVPADEDDCRTPMAADFGSLLPPASTNFAISTSPLATAAPAVPPAPAALPAPAPAPTDTPKPPRVPRRLAHARSFGGLSLLLRNERRVHSGRLSRFLGGTGGHAGGAA